MLGETRERGNQVQLLSHQLEMDAVANALAQHKHIWIDRYGCVNYDPA